jgi:DNA polymerase III epsilon subunit family exonuclease
VRSQPVRVAIDLETTGLHPEQDAVIEIGALKFAGEEVLDTFESFVKPGIILPYRIRRLTGITSAQLDGAPSLTDLLPRLRTFLGDYPLVGHSVPFDAAFLRRAGLARRNPLVDTYELASVLLPGLPSYTLASVGAALGVSSPTYHRALADAQLARDVFLALIQRLQDLDTGTLEMLGSLDAPADWTPGYFIRSLLREQRRAASNGAGAALGGMTLGDQLAAKLGMDPAVLGYAVADGAVVESAPSVAPTPRSDTATDGGAASVDTLAASLHACLTDGGALLVEVAPQPGGAEVALVPALEWADAHEGQVLVSAADGETARTLARTILPELIERMGIAPGRLPIAEVAERETYLCLHRWFGAARLAHDDVLSRDLTRGLARLAVWAVQTQTGSRIEIALPGAEAQAWERVRDGIEFAGGGAGCTYRRKGYCFTAQAERQAQTARLLVTTHTALARSLAGTDPMLPTVARLIVLDAHLLEDELRRAHSTAFDPREVQTLLDTLAHAGASGKRAGLLPLAARRDPSGQVARREPQWSASVERARAGLAEWAAALVHLMAEANNDQTGEAAAAAETADTQTLRIGERVRQLAAWNALTRAWTALDERLAAVGKAAGEAGPLLLAARGAKAALASDGVATDLAGIVHRLEALRRQGSRLFATGGDENIIFWLRVPFSPPAGQSAPPRGRHPAPATARASGAARHTPAASSGGGQSTSGAGTGELPVVHSAPVQIGRLLAPLHEPGRALVVTGSALAVSGEFTYMRGCLGLPDATPAFSTNADCTDQTLLCLPTDVPEPSAAHYQRHLDEALIALATTLGGRLVALFPSHAALRAGAMGIRQALERRDILVLAQGVDGSARQLWQTFRSEPRVVLLGAGAGTFWDSAGEVDVPPACVVVTRVPFPALSDPLLAARADVWADPQHQFVVPHAALRLRQALNRLAWSHTRRNAVMLFDRRVQTRGYGQTLLDTLPRCTPCQDAVAQISERVGEWVARG